MSDESVESDVNSNAQSVENQGVEGEEGVKRETSSLTVKSGAENLEWRSLLDDEYKEKYPDIRDVNNLMKSYHEADKKLRSGDKIIKPGENASDEEKQAYEDQLLSELGLKGEPDDYDLEFSKDLPQEFSQALDDGTLEPYKKWAMENKVSPDAYEALVNMYLDDQLKATGQVDEVIEKNREETINALKEKWGDEFDDRVKKTADIVRAFKPELLEEPRYANDPMFIEFADWVSQNMTVEEEGKIRQENVNNLSDVNALREKARELNNKSNDGKLPYEDRKNYALEARDIYKKIEKMSSRG